jgi:drug/metabolite transporter (DMT)-like permease
VTKLANRLGLSVGVLSALLIVYLVWGSTYLAIRFAIDTLPPFSMSGLRFLIAGAVLYIWARATGVPRPERAHWPAAAGIGALLLLGGNGAVVWAVSRIPSGIAALLVAVEPVAVALLAPLVLGHRRAGLRVAVGLTAGVAGVAVLVVDPRGLDPTTVDLAGTMAVVFGAVSWAAGSLWSVRAALPASRAMSSALQMLTGGALLLAAGGAAGEWQRWTLEKVSPGSIAAFAYLVVFGSIVAFSAYGYLMRAAPPTVASTYAFVNPMVAVLLGWLVVSEPITWRVGAASALILAAVALMLRGEPRSSAEPAAEDEGTRTSPAVRSRPSIEPPSIAATPAEPGGCAG